MQHLSPRAATSTYIGSTRSHDIAARFMIKAPEVPSVKDLLKIKDLWKKDGQTANNRSSMVENNKCACVCVSACVCPHHE